MKITDNIVPYKKDFKLNIANIIFLLIFIYLAVCIYMSSKAENIVGYQVKKGTLAENRIYTGIALRDENIAICPDNGYVSLFVNDGQRVAYNDLIYAIDESGKLSDVTTKDPSVDNSLTKNQRNELRLEIQLFSRNFDQNDFSDSYSFETKIQNELSKIENRQLLESIDDINSLHVNDIINFYKAKDTGIVTYYFDGFEQKKAEDLSFDDFNTDNYEAKEILNDTLLEKGSFVYKFTKDENWSICILVSNDEFFRIADSDYLKVKFSKNQCESWGKVNVVKATENGTIVQLSFTNSMITFAKDRFVEIELVIEEDSGLKIPNSSIAENNFYLIDKAFVKKGGNSSSYGVNRKVVSNSGEISTIFTEVTIYAETETEYYVDTSALSIGDVLIYVNDENIDPTQAIPANNDFTVGKQGTLVGVYNINKGYADFKKVNVLYSNDEYSIISANETLGLNAYDYIALDAKAVSNKDFVYY